MGNDPLDGSADAGPSSGATARGRGSKGNVLVSVMSEDMKDPSYWPSRISNAKAFSTSDRMFTTPMSARTARAADHDNVEPDEPADPEVNWRRKRTVRSL